MSVFQSGPLGAGFSCASYIAEASTPKQIQKPSLDGGDVNSEQKKFYKVLVVL